MRGSFEWVAVLRAGHVCWAAATPASSSRCGGWVGTAEGSLWCVKQRMGSCDAEHGLCWAANAGFQLTAQLLGFGCDGEQHRPRPWVLLLLCVHDLSMASPPLPAGTAPASLLTCRTA